MNSLRSYVRRQPVWKTRGGHHCKKYVKSILKNRNARQKVNKKTPLESDALLTGTPPAESLTPTSRCRRRRATGRVMV